MKSDNLLSSGGKSITPKSALKMTQRRTSQY